jgi:hypothetical protein
MFDLVSDWPLRTSSRRAFAALRQAPLAIGLATLIWLIARGAGLFVLASFVPSAQAAPRPELPGDLFASQPTEVQGALRFLCGTVFLVVLWTLAAWADAGFLRVVLDALRTPRRASLRPFLQPGSAFGRMLAYHVASGLLVFGAGLVVVIPGSVVAALAPSATHPVAYVGTALALVPFAIVYVVLGARLLFAPHAIVLEGRDVKGAIRDSLSRTRGNLGALLLFVIGFELVEAVSAFGVVGGPLLALVTVSLAHAWSALVVMERWVHLTHAEGSRR